MKKTRLDLLLVDRGLVSTREKARRLILAGQVRVNGATTTKAGAPCADSDQLDLKQPPRYVSRGGDKMESFHKISKFPIQDFVFMDVGASTGGFTDYLLQNGAARIYAVDVGTNQLAYSLRQNQKVVCLEKTHIKSLQPIQIPEPIDGFVCDVSFISLDRVIPLLKKFGKTPHFFVLLVKPQFEVQKEQVGKGGVVRHRSDILQALLKIASVLYEEDYGIEGVEFSRVAGPKGNVEFFFWASSDSSSKLAEPEFEKKIIEKEVFFSQKS